MGTECSYDYVFVYDGDSFDAPLLGSFSGKTEPQNVTASSGYVSYFLFYALHVLYNMLPCFGGHIKMSVLAIKFVKPQKRPLT